jgi:hypothetical protein
LHHAVGPAHPVEQRPDQPAPHVIHLPREAPDGLDLEVALFQNLTAVSRVRELFGF